MKTVEKKETGEKLEVSEPEIFLRAMTWHAAKDACNKLGEGWRLPTRSELKLLYENKEELGGFHLHYYWTSELYNEYDAYVVGFGLGTSRLEHTDFNSRNGVRLVR